MDKRLIKNIFIKIGANRIIIIIIAAAIIAAGIGAYFILQKSEEISPKCGDGICGLVERERGICPEDCKEPSAKKTCKEQSGDICSASEICGGSFIDASDASRCCNKECKVPTSPCTENWQCGNWSVCANSKQTRTCNDSNKCGTAINKPSESQNCEGQPPVSKTPEEINQDSPFATNDFGIPSGVAKALKITTKEQMTKEIEQSKIPLLENIGAKWVRQHPNYFATFGWTGVDSNHDGQNLDFTLTDALVKLAQNHSIRILAGLSPLPFDTEWQTASTYIPQNKDAYSLYVKQTVERYDGDGKDDMPGLKYPIKYWQMENEPDLHNKFRKQRGNANFLDPEEYFEVLKLTYNAVKQADSASRVMLNVVGYGQNMGDTSADYLRQLNELGAGNYYDIFSYHVYPNTYETSILTELLQKFKQLIGNKSVWITESGINGKLGETEQKQAAWVIKHYVSNIAGGVKKIDWLTFSDMSPNVPESAVAKYSGLTTSDSSTKKLSYYTYKKMIEVLEGSDWDNTQKIQESGGVYIYKFTKNNKPIWVAWNDNSGEKQITISGVNSSQVNVTEAVPKYDSGKDVASYSTAFNTEIKSVSQGKIILTLKEKPIFIEEK